MRGADFKIHLKKIHWLQNFGDDDDLDLCAHGKVQVIIGNEIIADNNHDENDWWCLSAMALHLLRTLDMNHTKENPVGDCLVPANGHHIDHHKDDPFVHIETEYFISGAGENWWVVHLGDKVRLETESTKVIVIPFINYKEQVLSFADKVQDFYKISKPKKMPDDHYDKEGYIKLWKEWNERRSKW
jgi:hypothetical protein